MKKILLVVIMGLLIGTAAFADHANDSFAIGAVFGAGVGIDRLDLYFDFYPVNLSFHIPKVPIMWGVNMKVLGNSRSRFGLGITGDWYFAEPNLVSATKTNKRGSYDLKIDWYAGIGFYANMYMLGYNNYLSNSPFVEKSYLGGDGGIRIPFGVSYHVLQNIKQLEVSVGSVAGIGAGGGRDKYNLLGVDVKDKHDPYVHWFFIPLEIAVRWWFD